MVVRNALVDINGEVEELPVGDTLTTTLQDAYDNSVPATVLLDGTSGPFTLSDNAAPIGDVFVLEDSGGVDFFNVDPLQLNFGIATQRLFEANNVIAGYGGILFYPDDFTRTVAGQSAMQWSSTLTSAVPGGGGIGNDTAPNFVNWNGEVILTEQGNLFNTQSLFVQGTNVTCQGANTGPIYTMINQPKFRTGSLGGSRTGSQQNAVRSQPGIGPNIAGNFTLASHEAFFATVLIDATIGTASVTTCNYFAAKAPTLTAGGTVGTLHCIDIVNIPAAGITNLRGINSAMASGSFIRHTGVAPSEFAGDVHMNNGVSLVLGTAGGNRVEMLRPSAGVARIIGVGGTFNEGLDFDFDGASNVVAVTSSTGAGLQIGTTTLGFYGATPVVQSPAYTPTNVVADRTYDANATNVDELADVLGTLIADLQATGLIA